MFIPHTTKETEEMLKVVGVSNLDELFNDIPINYRFPDLDLPPAQSEMEILSELQELSTGNESCRDLACFLGAGSYNHYIPAVVDSILRRSEFYTAYTPYQPEVSQGTLQAIFEFQSLIASLTGMDASNASHYDGATATAEAVIMAYHHFRSERNKIILTRGVNPQFRDVIRTYTKGYQELTLVGDDPLYGTELGSVKDLFDRQTALIIVQYPDFLGRMLDYTQLVDFAHAQGALVAIIVNPVTLGLLKTPGDFNADIAIGEGQPLGISMSFGGPYLGFFATRKELIRKISGRLVGQTQDASGKRGYVLTLTAREQHIRRERATSNICTNQGLMALAATVYLSSLGKQGLKQVANLCYQKAHYAAQQITAIPGYELLFQTPFFNEFSVRCPRPVEEINDHLLEHGILGGYDLSTDYTEFENTMLVAVTEMNTRDEIDTLCQVLGEVDHE